MKTESEIMKLVESRVKLLENYAQLQYEQKNIKSFSETNSATPWAKKQDL